MILTADSSGPNQIIIGQQRGVFVSNTSFITDLLHSNSSDDLGDAAAQLADEPRPYRDVSRQDCLPEKQSQKTGDFALNLKHLPNLFTEDSQPTEAQKA